MDKEPFEDVCRLALVENTAQGIYNELEKLKNLGSSHKRRWVWELCQNAVDSAKGRVAIEVELRNDVVIFRHDGHPFEESEIAHLIYHGSTKRGEGGKLGRWGTGFLTTHLLSELTKVTGTMSDDRTFSLTLDRSGESAEAIKDSMERSKTEFQNSRASGSAVKPKAGFTTEYEYSLNQVGVSVALTGTEDLRKIAQYVLALNDEIGSIVLVDSKGEETFVKSGMVNVGDKIYLVQVENRALSRPDQPQHLNIVVAKEKDLSIGAGLIEKDGQIRFNDCSDMPRLFVAFPLYSTEDFSFPVVINCRGFVPTLDRDGIFAGVEVTPANLEDKKRLICAIHLLFMVLDYALNKAWLDVHLLAKFTKPLARSWLDTKWYEEQLKTSVLTKLMETKVVCSKEKWITPKEAMIPIPGDLDELWNLAAYLYEDKLPSKDLCPSWASIINGWASLLGKKPEELEQSLTVDKLAQAVSQIGSLQKLEAMLKKEEPAIIQPIDWLNRFIRLLFATNHQQLLDSLSLLPNQNGVFRKRNDIRADQGIDDSLKDIAKNLGQDTRDRLLHLQMVDEAKKLVTPMPQDELLDQLLKLAKDFAKVNPNIEPFQSANVALFWWLVSNHRNDRLAGYPVFCRRTNEKGDESIGYLGGKETMLAPVERWPERSQKFVELFPLEFVMSSKYWRPSETWDTLQSQKLILCGPIYSLPKSLGEDVLMESLAFGEQMSEEGEHRMENVAVSDIVFLKLENRGIIDLVRNSKERARLFLRFLLDFALDFDNSALDPAKLTCKCGGAHSVYTSNWLLVLKTQKWIPVAKGKSDTPSAKNLAALLQNQPEMLDNLVGNKPSKFFNNLNVSISDIMKFVIAKDEETKLALDNATGRLYKSFGGNTKRLTRLAELIESEPNIMVELEKKISDLERVRRNQQVGATVEKIFKELFETEDMKQQGFRIERTGLGSDFALEHDLVENGQEQLLGISKGNKKVLIELKTATENYVRMTTTQGETAVANLGSYILCVVPLGDEVGQGAVRDNSRFVLDIGNKLVDEVARVNELQQKSIEVSSVGGEVGIEVSEGIIRYRISKQVWEVGSNFLEFLDYLRHNL
jgi:hypothetical protein